MHTYVFKLYDNKHKLNKLQDELFIYCKFYNKVIALCKRYYRLYHKTLSFIKIQKHFANKRLTKQYDWLKGTNSQTRQDTIQRIEKAYKRHFAMIKLNRDSSLPSFKKFKKYKSFTLKSTGYKLFDGYIVFNNIKYKYFNSRVIYGNVKTVTFKRNTIGEWFIVIICDEENCPTVNRIMTGKSAGFDFGFRTFLTGIDTNGTTYEQYAPQFLLKTLERLRKLNKDFSRKEERQKHQPKGSTPSRNYFKALKRLQKLYIDITNQRNDFQWKLANQMSLQFDIIIIENLNFNAMKHLWGRKLSDLSPSSFYNKLEFECYKNGSKLIKIDRFYPSSKLCSVCGNKNTTLKFEKRWICDHCGTEHDRDINAAINILTVGISTVSGDSSKPCAVLQAEIDDRRIPLL